MHPLDRICLAIAAALLPLAVFGYAPHPPTVGIS
jgi:hypothetical protein